MRLHHRQRLTGALAAGLGLALLAAPALADVGFRYKLADFAGTVPYSQPHLYADPHHDEVYVVFTNEVRVFNETGMETYSFLAPLNRGWITDLAVDEGGDILVLSRDVKGLTDIWRCDYRGRLMHYIPRTGWPSAYADLPLDRLFLVDGRLLLVSEEAMQVVEATVDGGFVRGWDLGAMLNIDEADRANQRIGQVNVDRSGNLLLTIPVLFRAFVVSPDGEVRDFGTAGSGPGRFGIVSGIAADADGHLFVADKLRHVVMMFDEQFQFVQEFGRMGMGPENLRGPSEIAVGPGGTVYVTQQGRRGVSVFTVGSE